LRCRQREKEQLFTLNRRTVVTTALVVDDRKTRFTRISHELAVPRFLQPDDVTCGPTCLRTVYNFFGLDVELQEVLGELDRNEDGGTLAVFLGISAMTRGFRARLYSYDLRIFDPTWHALSQDELAGKIRRRLPYLDSEKVLRAAEAYLDFLDMGGTIRFDELTPGLLKSILDSNHPVLAGLSAPHLYRMPRERHDPVTHALVDDDVAGEPTGHFVVIVGYQHWGRRFSIRDPSAHVPGASKGRVVVDSQRLINAILLGDLTYDAVLLELWPREGKSRHKEAAG
jgi:hypothetical protein